MNVLLATLLFIISLSMILCLFSALCKSRPYDKAGSDAEQTNFIKRYKSEKIFS